ncbi:MAG TPA: bZIP transcription factor [Allosphingosinicella sp.]|nr:bZIP transcription factor [Allosphingosinicella sp.]
MRLGGLAAAAAVLAAGPAAAQGVTIEDLARRVEALERENEALKAEVRRLAAPPVAAAPAPAPAYEPPPVHAPPPPVDESSNEAAEPWDRAYLGLHAGYARLRARYRSPGFATERPSADGGSFGAQIGRRWQNGPVVAGVELEADFPLLDDVSADVFAPGAAIYRLDLQARGRVKGMVGFASGPWLAYGTAGLEQGAFARGVTPAIGSCGPGCVNFTVLGPTQFERRFYSGFLLGLGAGYAFADGTSIELEGTRTTYGFSSTSVGDLHPRSSVGVTVRLNQPIP